MTMREKKKNLKSKIDKQEIKRVKSMYLIFTFLRYYKPVFKELFLQYVQLDLLMFMKISGDIVR